MFVLIQDNKAYEIFSELPKLHVALMNNIVEYVGDVQEGWIYSNGIFSPPPLRTPQAKTRATKLAIYEYLDALGLWDPIQEYLDANPKSNRVWLLASYVDIHHPLVVYVQAMLNWTDEQVQEMFNIIGEV